MRWRSRCSRPAGSPTRAASRPRSRSAPTASGSGRASSWPRKRRSIRVYRELLLSAEATDTLYSSVFDGGWPDAPHRTLRNSTLEAWQRAGSAATGSRPGEGEVVARRPDGSELRRYASALPLAEMEGEIEALSLWAGQSVGLVRDVRPAAEIVAELAAGLA